MLTSFGTFWSGEGIGVSWPGSDAMLLGMIAFVLLVALGLCPLAAAQRARRDQERGGMKQVKAFGRFWYDFVVGDDWRIAVSVVLLLAVTGVLARRWNPWPLLPLGVALTLMASLRRAAR